MPYNVITCGGFDAVSGWVASASCLKARMGFVLLFFLIAVTRKWGGEEIGLEFNFPISLIAGILSYFIVITIFGNLGLAFVFGIALALVGGYGSGLLFGSWGGDE